MERRSGMVSVCVCGMVRRSGMVCILGLHVLTSPKQAQQAQIKIVKKKRNHEACHISSTDFFLVDVRMRLSRETPVVLQSIGAMLSTRELHDLQRTHTHLQRAFMGSMKHRKWLSVFAEFLGVVSLLKRTRHTRLCFISPGYRVVVQITVNSVHIPGGYRVATYIPKNSNALLSNTLGSPTHQVHGVPGKRIWNLLLSGWTVDLNGVYDRAHKRLTTYR
jgi:hypothetical protein